jgi:hypothetical protein
MSEKRDSWFVLVLVVNLNWILGCYSFVSLNLVMQ